MTKLVICPPVPGEWLAALASVQGLQVSNVATEDDGVQEIADADCFYGTITGRLLETAGRLRWIQARSRAEPRGESVAAKSTLLSRKTPGRAIRAADSSLALPAQRLHDRWREVLR